MTKRRELRIASLAAAAVLALGLGACDLVDELLDRDDRAAALRAVAVESLAGPETPFLDRIGDGPPLRTETVSDSLVRVVVPDEDAPNGEAAWELAWSRIDVFPVHDGQEFAAYVQERATARDRRAGLTQEGWSLIADGRVEAVGRVEGEARVVGGRARVPVKRVAYLEPVAGREEPRWTLQPDTRTVIYLWRALDTAYESLMYRDERVMDCAGTAEPTSTPRPVLLECAVEVLASEFDEEAPD